MSLKPLKVNDIKKDQQRLNDKMKKKNILDDLPPHMFIISEGTKTEVVYIEGFVNAINDKYANFSTGKRIEVRGTGRNCQSLLSYARKQVLEIMPQASVIWLMYDRDDFPLDNFTTLSLVQNSTSTQGNTEIATRVFELIEELRFYL